MQEEFHFVQILRKNARNNSKLNLQCEHFVIYPETCARFLVLIFEKRENLSWENDC